MDKIFIEIEKNANEFRAIHGLSDNEPLRIKSLLMKLNVITLFKPLNENLSGMAILYKLQEKTFRFMLINSNHQLGKQHFTICHELYHLFVQKDFKVMFCSTGKFDKRDPIEYRADLFASELLMPRDAILSLIPQSEIEESKISLGTVIMLEQYFSASRSAMLMRLKNLKLIKDADHTAYKENVKASAIAYGYDLTLYKKGNTNKSIGDYGTLAKKLFDSHKISESHYYNLIDELELDIMDIGNEEDNN